MCPASEQKSLFHDKRSVSEGLWEMLTLRTRAKCRGPVGKGLGYLCWAGKEISQRISSRLPSLASWLTRVAGGDGRMTKRETSEMMGTDFCG